MNLIYIIDESSKTISHLLLIIVLYGLYLSQAQLKSPIIYTLISIYRNDI